MATKTRANAWDVPLAIENLQHAGVTAGSRIFTTTDYVGNVGTAYVRVFLILDGERVVNYTHSVATAAGLQMKERDGKRYIVTKGYGYSRAQYVADSLSWAMFGEPHAISYSEL